jgi:hypothetical protein
LAQELELEMGAWFLAKGRPREPEYAIGERARVDLQRQPAGPAEEAPPRPAAAGRDVLALRGLVLDPFAGSGSTLLAAKRLGRQYLGTELDADYHAIAKRRLERESI